MKKISKRKILIGLLAIPVLAGLVYLFLPAKILLKAAIKAERSRAGLVSKTTAINLFQMPYLEREGKNGTLLLLHGFGGNKDNWTRFVRHVRPDLRVISPDLPGFGESDRVKGQHYDILSQTRRVKEFLNKLNITRVHVAGNSMGGHLAAMLASEYPDLVQTLTIVNGAGVTSPQPPEHKLILEKTGRNVLLVSSRQDFYALMDFIFDVKPKAPKLIINYLADEAIRNRPWNDAVYREYKGTWAPLEPRLGRMKMPSLVIWGDHDRVIHVSSTDVFRRLLPQAKIVIMKNCGHSPMLERPEETAGIFNDFLNRSSLIQGP